MILAMRSGSVRTTWLTAVMLVLLSGLATLTGLAVAWCLSALVLAAGTGGVAATLTGLLVAAAVPLGAAAWKYGRWPRPYPIVVAAWNVAVLLALVIAVPDPLGLALREHGWALSARVFGEEHRATRVASMLSHDLADVVSEHSPANDVAVSDPDSTSVVVPVELVGPGGTASRRYLFDTGASYTTITSEAAAKIGLTVPANAPVVPVDTAAGRRDAAMVHLPAIRVSGVELKHVAVTICDACDHERSKGLLGLNVIRRFDATLDARGQLQLNPAANINPTYDVAPFVGLEVVGPPELIAGRHVHWLVQITNNSTEPLRDVAPRVTFPGDEPTVLLGKTIQEIPAGGSARSRVVGRVKGSSNGNYRLRLATGHW